MLIANPPLYDENIADFLWSAKFVKVAGFLHCDPPTFDKLVHLQVFSLFSTSNPAGPAQKLSVKLAVQRHPLGQEGVGFKTKSKHSL